jgi:serine kinase of HPr protein (carbohydrate metabolism regulator)
MTEPATVHASAVLLGEHGVLIRGPAGSGKSSLLLGLLTDPQASTRLIADDRVILTPANGRLIAVVPPALAGLLEIRGQGIVRRPFVSPARLHFVVDVVPLGDCDRMPMPQADTISVASIELPLLRLPIGIADGPVRVRAAVAERLLPTP